MMNVLSNSATIPYAPSLLYIQQNSNAWALLGDVCYLSGDLDAALDAYQRVVDYAQPPGHLHTTLLRLADIYTRKREV